MNLETNINIDRITKAPINPELTKDKLDPNPNKENPPNTTIATPKVTPELIPNTPGPANGFLKNTCKISPVTDKAPPPKSAIIVLFNLPSTIYDHDSLVTDSPFKIFIKSWKEIETSPTEILHSDKTVKRMLKVISSHISLFFFTTLTI